MIGRREVELENPGILAKAQQGYTSLVSIIRWYIDSFETTPIGSAANTLHSNFWRGTPSAKWTS